MNAQLGQFAMRAFTIVLVALAIQRDANAIDTAPDQVPARIAELRADDYFAREQATEALAAAGAEAVAPLVEAIAAGELETTARAITILGRLANSTDAATSAAAEAALDRLAESKDSLVAGRAKTALRERQEMRREAAAAKLQQLGANLQFQDGQLYMVIIQSPAWHGAPEDWRLLKWFPELTMLMCRDIALDDAALGFLSPESKLQQLRLIDVRVNDAGLAHLERLPDMQVLQVIHANITDASLRIIGQLEPLQVLYLVGGDVTDAGIQQLAGLKSLRNVRLESLPLTDASLTTLLRFDNMEWIDLNRLPKIQGEPFKDLGSLPRLENFYVKYCPVGEATLAGLEQCRGLQRVRLLGTNISIEAADKYAAEHPAVEFDHRTGGLLGVMALPDAPTCQLQEVRPGMGAAQAGIVVNDVITHIDGEEIRDFNALRALIRPKAAGEVVEIRGKRDGVEFTKHVTLSEDQE